MKQPEWDLTQRVVKSMRESAWRMIASWWLLMERAVKMVRLWSFCVFSRNAEWIFLWHNSCCFFFNVTFSFEYLVAEHIHHHFRGMAHLTSPVFITLFIVELLDQGFPVWSQSPLLIEVWPAILICTNSLFRRNITHKKIPPAGYLIEVMQFNLTVMEEIARVSSAAYQNVCL